MIRSEGENRLSQKPQTYYLKIIPLPSSVPAQLTLISPVVVAARVWTWLVGALVSILFDQTRVSMGALVSKTMLAWASMIVALATLGLALTL
jgi:hypothetical protein